MGRFVAAHLMAAPQTSLSLLLHSMRGTAEQSSVLVKDQPETAGAVQAPPQSWNLTWDLSAGG